MLVTDDTGCYVGANRAAVHMTGYSVNELRGQPVERLFPYVSGSSTRCRLQILLPASSSLPTNMVLHTKSAFRWKASRREVRRASFESL
jgi:PAS domain S-box-containing protein